MQAEPRGFLGRRTIAVDTVVTRLSKPIEAATPTRTVRWTGDSDNGVRVGSSIELRTGHGARKMGSTTVSL